MKPRNERSKSAWRATVLAALCVIATVFAGSGLPATANAQDQTSNTGLVSPTTVASSTCWALPQWMLQEDSQYAYTYLPRQDCVTQLGGFNFNIPAGIRIMGITIQAVGYVQPSSSAAYPAFKFPGIPRDTPLYMGGESQTYTLGGPNDLWGGKSWEDPSFIEFMNSPDFTLSVSLNERSGQWWYGRQYIYLDSVRMRVYYAAKPQPTPTPTVTPTPTPSPTPTATPIATPTPTPTSTPSPNTSTNSKIDLTTIRRSDLAQLVHNGGPIQRESDVDFVLPILRNPNHPNHASWKERVLEEIKLMGGAFVYSGPEPFPYFEGYKCPAGDEGDGIAYRQVDSLGYLVKPSFYRVAFDVYMTTGGKVPTGYNVIIGPDGSLVGSDGQPQRDDNGHRILDVCEAKPTFSGSYVAVLDAARETYKGVAVTFVPQTQAGQPGGSGGGIVATPTPTPTPPQLPLEIVVPENAFSEPDLLLIQQQLNQIASGIQAIRQQLEELSKTAPVSCAVVHTVRSGETLSGIALKYYGVATRWPEVYKTNKEVIGPNPSAIYSDQALCIPGEIKEPSSNPTALRVPYVLSPSSLYFQSADTVQFEGKGEPGSRVVLWRDGVLVDNAQVSSDGTWTISAVPVRVGAQTYTLQAIRRGEKSRVINYSDYRASTTEQGRARLAQSLFGSPAGRIITGEAENLQETAKAMALEFTPIGGAFGDARDFGKQIVLSLINDPDADPLVGGIALLGLATEILPLRVADSTLTTLKYGVRAARIIEKTSLLVGTAFRKAIVESLFDLPKLRVLTGRALAILSDANTRQVYERVLHNEEAVTNFVRYVDEGGEEVLSKYIEPMVGKFPNTKFRVTDDIGHVAQDHPGRLPDLKRRYGLPENASNAELAAKLTQTLQSQPVRKGILQYSDKGVASWENQYWFFNESTGVYAVFDDTGALITAYAPTKGFSYVMAGEKAGENFQWQMELK